MQSAMEIRAFVEDFDHCRKLYCRKPFVEQILTEHLLIKHLLMTASIKLQIIQQIVIDFMFMSCYVRVSE